MSSTPLNLYRPCYEDYHEFGSSGQSFADFLGIEKPSMQRGSFSDHPGKFRFGKPSLLGDWAETAPLARASYEQLKEQARLDRLAMRKKYRDIAKCMNPADLDLLRRALGIETHACPAYIYLNGFGLKLSDDSERNARIVALHEQGFLSKLKHPSFAEYEVSPDGCRLLGIGEAVIKNSNFEFRPGIDDQP